jgi:uncharacterized protein
MSPGRSSSNADVVDAALLAARGASLDRTFRLADLHRLAEWASGEDARLAVRFFAVDGRVSVTGRARAVLKLTCQRCLGAMTAPVDDEFSVVIVSSESAMDELPEQQEAVIANESQLDLAWLLEEQLLLAMPLVPVHDAVADCAKTESDVPAGTTLEKAAKTRHTEETQRPFANLRAMMKADE